MRLLADTNIMAPAVRALRNAGHDVVHSAERPSDPGDVALLAEAFAERRVFVTKDHDIGALVFRDDSPHCGVLLIDDLGDPAEETALLMLVVNEQETALTGGDFVRAGAGAVRVARE